LVQVQNAVVALKAVCVLSITQGHAALIYQCWLWLFR